MMNKLRMLKALLKKQEGQGMVEYALILSIISVAGIVYIDKIGPKVEAAFKSVYKAF